MYRSSVFRTSSTAREIMACVVLKDGETATEEEIKTFVRDHMAKHKVPEYVDFVESFPMNAAGKILRSIRCVRMP